MAMATTSLSSRRPATASILFFAVASIVLASHMAVAMEGGYRGLVHDHFIRLSPRAGSRFLAETDAAGKGSQCDPVTNNVCPGAQAKDGSELLQCCKKNCRNVLTDRNNCGACGNRCGYGQLCCSGECTTVAYDVKNCGTCGAKCDPGVRCEYGACGYA